MTTDFCLLEKLLNPTALVDIDPGKREAKLFETWKEYGIYVKKLPSETLIIKADNFSPDKIIDCQNNKDFCKRADYIIVNEYEIIFVELKYGKTNGKKHIKQQLIGAQCLMDYLIVIGRRFFNHPNFLKSASEKQYFVAIVNFKLNKRPTEFVKKQKHKANNSPEKMLCLKVGSAGSINYKQLFS